MSTFRVSIIATDKGLYEGLVNILILPAMDGEAAVMAHHEDMVMAVVAGEMRFQTEDGNWTDVVVGTGFVQMINNRALVLVDTAERPEDIDIVRAREAKERAQEQLRQRQSLVEYYHTQASLARAMSRLKAASKHK